MRSIKKALDRLWAIGTSVCSEPRIVVPLEPQKFGRDLEREVGRANLARAPQAPTPTSTPSLGGHRQRLRQPINNTPNTSVDTLIVESSSYHQTRFAMAPPEAHQLFHNPIADHSFSADKQTLAVARDTRVELYGRSGNGFKLKDELKGHDKTVTGVDVALHSGRIVTCSHGMRQGLAHELLLILT